MAKFDKQTNSYLPGVIYELRYYQDGVWTPFYVGETSDKKQRISSHQSMAKNATDDSQSVYKAAFAFNNANIIWDMVVVDNYGSEGPTDKEDEHIMSLLLQHIPLTNEKKGNAKWMERMQQEAREMKTLGMTSYRKFRKHKEKKSVEEKHNKWVEDHKREKHIKNIVKIWYKRGQDYDIKRRKADLKSKSLDELYTYRLGCILLYKEQRKKDADERIAIIKREKQKAELFAKMEEIRLQRLAEEEIANAKREAAEQKRLKELAAVRKVQQEQWEKQQTEAKRIEQERLAKERAEKAEKQRQLRLEQQQAMLEQMALREAEDNRLRGEIELVLSSIGMPSPYVGEKVDNTMFESLFEVKK